MSEKLRGCDLSRVNRSHLTKVVKKMPELKCDTSIESMVAALSDYLIKLHKATPANLLECDFCHGSSDASFSVCPFCGKDDQEATDAAIAAPAAEEKPLVNARTPKAPKEPKAEKPAKEAAPKAEKPAKAPKEPKAEKPAKAPKTKLAVVHTAEIVSSKQLDDAVVEIKRIQVSIVDNHWLLGVKLSETYEQNLHKLRVNDAGAPVYRNWAQWVEQEIGISPRYAFDLAAVSKVFSQDDIAQVGVTKLRPLIRIPEEAKRQNLLERAKRDLNAGGISKRELEAEVKGLPARKVIGGGSLGGEAAEAKRAEKTAARAATKGVTVVVQPGRVTLPLFASKLKKGSTNGPTRAFDLDEQPQAIEDLLNGVKVRYLITQEEDGLVLIVERIRE